LFCKKEKYSFSIKEADLNFLVQGGQLYSSLPFSKGSMHIVQKVILLKGVVLNVVALPAKIGGLYQKKKISVILACYTTI
jgi:hypothetical protein